MKRVTFFALLLCGLVACNNEANGPIDNPTFPADFDTLIAAQSGEIDDEALIEALNTKAMKTASGTDDYIFHKEKKCWIEGQYLRGGVNAAYAISFSEDGSCAAVSQTDASISNNHYAVSRAYFVINSSYEYDADSNTLYTVAADGKTKLAATVLYFNDDTLILDGALFGNGENIRGYQYSTYGEFNRCLVKYRFDNDLRALSDELIAKIENPILEVEQIVAKQSEAIDDSSFIEALENSKLFVNLELRYSNDTESWVDMWSINTFENFLWHFEGETTTIVRRHATMDNNSVTAACRYDAESDTLYTKSSDSGYEYAAKLLFWDNEVAVFDGELFLFEDGTASEVAGHRYMVVATIAPNYN